VVLHARGLLAGSVYYMDMKDFIAPQTRTATYKDQTASATAGSDVYASYLMSSPDNIDASVKGLELTYEQPLGDSFGRCQLHLCGRQHRNRQAAARHLEEHLQPVSYFEHDKLGARVSYTWRSAFYFGLRRSYPFYQDQFGTLSATVSYRFNDRFSLSLDGLNLNNPVYKYYTRSAAMPCLMPSTRMAGSTT
jgi:iron complex outermembrane receptor protein